MNARTPVSRRRLAAWSSLLACGLPLAMSASGQDLTRKAPPQSAPIAIVGATVHPVSAADVPDAVILFEHGTITSIEPAVSWKKPGGDIRVIDGHGKHVYPGLIAPATQMGLTEIDSVRASRDVREVGFQGVSPEVRAATAVNPDSWLLPVTRSNGVLTCAVMPTGGAIPGRASVIRMDGWTVEDLTIDGDAGLVINWPWMRTVNARWMDQGEDEQRRGTSRQLQTIDGAFDAAEAYFAERKANPATPVDLRWEAMAGVLGAGGKAKDPVFINASDYDQIVAAVTWAKRRGMKPVIVGGRDAPMCADLLKEAGASVILQGAMSMPRRDDSPVDDGYALSVKLEGAGIPWCMSSGDETPHERNLPYSAAIAVAYGLDKDAALRSVTLNAAKIIGVGDRLGSLESGKSATLLVTDGNPLEITTKIEHAFIDGREIDLSNKQTELDKKYRERYRQLNSK
jgi:imidazolonepropionase-like amidohydrolase